MSSEANPIEDNFDSGDSSSIDSDNDSGCDDVDFEWDLAITHRRNSKLREEKVVSDFFVVAKKFRSSRDPESRAWLRSLPYFMRNTAIPLFETETDGASEDYQLHPSFSWLKAGKSVEDHDPYFYQLENDNQKVPGFFIPLGRLFVNMPNDDRSGRHRNSKRSRLTRWTGYEIFISDVGALWIVFDEHSLTQNAEPWYPVSCSITDPDRIAASKPSFGIACLVPAHCDLDNITFNDALTSVQNTNQIDTVWLCEVDKSQVKFNQEDQNETLTQEAGDRIGKEKQTEVTVKESKAAMSQASESLFDVNSEDDQGRTPLWHAIHSADIFKLDSLLKIHDAQLDEPIGSRETPLSLAVKCDNVDAVRLLISTGKVNVNQRNRRGQLPISLALQDMNKDIVEQLLQTREVDLHAIDLTPPVYKTPLDHAVEAIARKHDRMYSNLMKYVTRVAIDHHVSERFEKRAESGDRYAILKLLREYRRVEPLKPMTR